MCLRCSLPSVGMSLGNMGISGAVFFIAPRKVFCFKYEVISSNLSYYRDHMIQLNMPKKSLKDTNPYLRLPDKYRKSLITNVSSSSAIETASSSKTISDILIKSEGKLWIIETKNRKGSSR
jgi:uncharacterized membrane protein